MRYLLGFMCVLALGAMGCGETSGTGGTGGSAGMGGEGGWGITYLKASNTDPFDLFGTVSLSADGQTLAVGATGEASAATGVNGDQSDNSAPRRGAAYVFTRSGESWSQEAYLKGDGLRGSFPFGHALSLSADGDTLAVGGGLAGGVYVFTRTRSSWSEQARLEASNADPRDFFGASVSLAANGNTLAVSAMVGSSGAGAVYVFTRSNSEWSQQAYIKASNTDPGDSLAVVSLSGDGQTLAVAARSEDSAATGVNGNQDDNSASEAGAVYVFARSGSSWSQQAYIKASNTDPGDWLGSTVNLNTDGTVLAVGAVNESSSAVVVNGDQDDNSASEAGAVYVFARNGDSWSQQAYVKATNTDEGDEVGGENSLGVPTGLSLSADGQTRAVGALGEDSAATGLNGDQSDNSAEGSGAAYVYELD